MEIVDAKAFTQILSSIIHIRRIRHLARIRLPHDQRPQTGWHGTMNHAIHKFSSSQTQQRLSIVWQATAFLAFQTWFWKYSAILPDICRTLIHLHEADFSFTSKHPRWLQDRNYSGLSMSKTSKETPSTQQIINYWNVLIPMQQHHLGARCSVQMHLQPNCWRKSRSEGQ